MKKILSAVILLSGCACTLSATTQTEPKDFSHFQREGIAKRNSAPVVLPGERVLPQKPVAQSMQKTQKKSEEKDGLFSVRIDSPIKTGSERPIQKMDSVVRKSIIGENISRQVFSYTSIGQYLRSDNYLADEDGNWVLYNFYNYEYDNLGRLVMREMINDDYPYGNQRYEYFYDNDTDLYSSEIFYMADYETGELTPWQKGEYQYDEYGNPIEQTFFSWSNEASAWLLSGRETVSFDRLGRQTSYFKYVVDEGGTELVGSEGESYEYVLDTEIDAEVDRYTWENDEWLKYERHIYTYEEGLLMKNEFVFWNRAKQDWSGGDTYGEWEYVEDNFYTDYTYDSLGRIVEALAYRCNSEGEYVNNAVDEYSYTELEDGDVEREYIQSFMWQGPYISPFKRDIQRFNAFGAETYYKNFSYMSGEERATAEEIRVIDANNMYHEGWFYGFTNDEANTRYGQSREEFGYPEDWDGVTYAPSYGMHWKGTGYDTDTSWVEDSKMEYEWHDDLMIGCATTIWEDSTPCKYSQWFIEFDYDVPASDLWKWFIDIRGEEVYKVTGVEQYLDMDQDGEWDEVGWSASYIDKFFYSDVISTGVAANEALGDVVEIERYDLSGCRLEAPVRGVNIVKYSDGSVRKIIVK